MTDLSRYDDAVLALLRGELPVDSVWELPEATWPDGFAERVEALLVTSRSEA